MTTGQGMLGYNMFAYCNNSPISLTDSTGSLPVGYLVLADFYFIHKRVQRECKQNKGWETEVRVTGSGKNGRLDLYDSTLNTYYEVKSRGAAYNISGNIRTSTDNQMTFYDQATISSKKVPNANGLQPTRGNEYVSGSFEHGVWDVEYKLEKPGLIVYNTTLNSQRASKIVVIAVAIGLAALTQGASLSFTVPALAMIGG